MNRHPNQLSQRGGWNARGSGHVGHDRRWGSGDGRGRGGWSNDYDNAEQVENWRDNRQRDVFPSSTRGDRNYRHPDNHYQRGRGVSRAGEGVTGRRQLSPDEGNKETEKQGQPFLKIRGSCEEMCPLKERLLREREGLLHKFEILPDVSQPSSWLVEGASHIGPCEMKGVGRNQGKGRKPLPKADVQRTIKSFARSAAGQDKTLSEDLRPAGVLKDTVTYLCDEILTRTDCPFVVVYDFAFDRLRAIRQDLVVQRIEDVDAIRILETIVKFHIYSGFRLQEEHISIYDPHINQKHLVDCLRKLLSLYEFNKYKEASRAEFEALNCLVYINSYDVITRAFSIQKEIDSIVLNIAIEMVLSYQCKNFIRFFRRMGQLSTILQMYCVRHVGPMRQFAFRTMCLAYGTNSCKIPLSWITSHLLYTSVSETHKQLGRLNVEIIRDEINNEKYAKFQKAQAHVIQSKVAEISSDFISPIIKSIMNDTTSGALSKLCLSL